MNQPDLKEYSKSFCVYAEERSGVDGPAFFRRGLPFAQGILKDEEQFYLKGEDGTAPPLQTQVIERHSDGSVKWLSVAFSAELKPYQKYRLDGVFKKRAANGKILAKETADGLSLENEKLKVTVGQGGICSLLSEGKETLGKKGIFLSVRDECGKHLFRAEKTEVYINGGVYAVARLEGRFADTNVFASWFITLYDGESRVRHEVKFNSRGANVLYAETLETELADTFQKPFCAERAEHAGRLFLSDWAAACQEDGGNVVMASKDVRRFHKATAPTGIHSGYALEGQTIVFAPIQYDMPFEWPDGVTRTMHLDMSFSGTESVEQRGAKETERSFSAPILTIPSKWFVAIGVTDDDSQSEAITRNGRVLASMYGFYWNHFEAGKLPNTMEIDFTSETVIAPSTMDRSHGEVNYNLWRTYMNSGEPRLYDLNMDSVEHWTDIIQYRGMYEELCGANRYHSGDFFNDHEAFCTSMPYYGDLCGLYMTYCMTGDPYVEECFREGIDFFEEDIRRNGVPLLSYWTKNMYAVHKSPEFQYRCCSIVRCLYFAYRLYGEERYNEAAKSIIRWLSEGQNANGSFYEDYYYDTKEPCYVMIDGKRTISEKTYIMTFGARGLADYCRASGDTLAVSVLEKLADYMISTMDERGFMWSPNASSSVYDIGNNRGSCGVTSSGAAYFISGLYQATGRLPYFTATLKLIRFCISQWGAKGSSGQLQGSQTPYLQAAQTASKMIKENMELALKEGFADIAAVLDTNTRQTYGVYPCHDDRYQRFALNTFDTIWGKIVYFNHRMTPLHGDTSQNKAFDFEFEISNDSRLWYGDTIYVTNSSDSVMLRKPVRVVEIIHLLQTDITVSDLTGEAEVEIVTYTRDEITILLRRGSGFAAHITDGFFHVTDGAIYTVTQGSRVTEAAAKDSALEFEVLPGSNVEITLSKKK